MEKDIEKLKKQSIEWTNDNLGLNFKFRKYQLESIVNILRNIVYDDGPKINVMEAPTGSGKSIIAIIICGVLWKYYKKKSYILVSDINLLHQYISDFNRFGLKWGHMMGLSNYNCMQNGFIFPSGECKLQHVSYKILMNKKTADSAGFPCASSCSAIQDRINAIQAPITLMTYQLYFYEMNFVRPLYFGKNKNEIPFDTRDFVIGDECHKLPEIIQDLCAPVFSLDIYSKISFYINFAKKHELPFPNKLKKEDYLDFEKNIFNAKTKSEAFSFFKKYYDFISHIASIAHESVTYVTDNKINVKKDKDSSKAIGFSFEIDQVETTAKCFITAIELSGVEDIVVNCNNFNNLKMNDLKMNSIRDGYIVKSFFHDVSKKELLMSATIGDVKIFGYSIGSELIDKKNYYFNRIPSTFDFTKSPIYIMKNLRMSYKLKDQNFPKMIDIINKICEFHKNQKGIIHTGSYDFANHLFEGSSYDLQSRLLAYHNSRDKETYLNEFLDSSNKIIVGPSLIEGINLPDENCRFMILMKVPYASLANKLVKEKNDMIQGWYAADTIKKVIQSLGRGIRHKDDWCITYILDSCFIDLINKTYKNLNPELAGRFKFIN